MAKKEKKDKEEKKKEKKEKKEKKGKKEKKEKEEKPKKEKKEKKGKKDKKEKKEKPKKEKKKKGKKGEPEEPETEEVSEGKGKKGKKDKKKADKADKKDPNKDSGKAPKKTPPSGAAAASATKGGEVPEGAEGAEAIAAEEPKYPWFNLSWAVLHILAMALMLCDHLWPTVFPAADWLTCLGRMSYPLFAFLLVEGFFHTENLWWYLLRLVGLAILSEIPFNLMVSGSIVYPLHQNVIWTYIIALLFLILLEEFKDRFGTLPMLLFSIVPAFLGYFLGQVLLTDYYGAGVLVVLMFYICHGRSWYCLLGQLVGMWLISFKLVGGFYYIVPFLGYDFDLVQQGLSILSLVFVWLYHGRQGLHGRVFRWFCYVFYPAHMLVLFIIRVRLGT